MTLHRLLTPLTALTLLVAAVAGLSALSPSRVQGAAGPAAEAATSGIFVGRVADSNALIGIVTNGDSVIAYVCDNVVADWFRGQVVDGSATLTSAGGAHLTIDFSAATPSGTVQQQDGSVLSFGTEAAEGVAGLYRAEATIDAVPWVGGWIVLGDGDGRGDVHPMQTFRDRPVAQTAGAGLESLDLATLTATFPGGVTAQAQRLTPSSLIGNGGAGGNG